jgi:CRISPR/Cas system-associated exonuclease Cas4 (RecB family)
VERELESGVTNPTEIRRSFAVRNAIQAELKKVVEGSKNPRLKLTRILPRISVDDCVNAFRGASSVLDLPVIWARKHTGSVPKIKTTGAEVVIDIATPPINGRLDYLRDGQIVDFKTGEESPDHHGQLQFYALLFWLSRGTPPESLTLVYVREGRRVVVDVPSLDQLAEMASSIHDETDKASRQILDGPPQAKPSESTCKLCPVRQLCDQYWTDSATTPLRLTRETLSGSGDVEWADAEVVAFPAKNRVGGCVGPASVSDTGVVQLSMGSMHIPAQLPTTDSKARILNARIERAPLEPFTLTVTTGSEVFWATAPEPES